MIDIANSSFIAGALPLTLQLSQQRLRLISAIGTGVLVGTALIVIIPEGIETLYSAHASSNPRDQSPTKDGKHPVTRTQHGAIITRAEHSHEDVHKSSPHAWIGLALIAGYILMYVIDTLPALTMSLSRPRALHVSLSDLSQGLHHNSASPPGSPTLYASSQGFKHAPATTIGLVIHAFADGIALGASTASSSARSNLGLVVFLAIMLHKAPAAFGLTSVLLKQGLSKREARAHLLVFSLAAPVGAFVTWALVNLLGKGGKAEGEGELWLTGVVLVFSGGTFL